MSVHGTMRFTALAALLLAACSDDGDTLPPGDTGTPSDATTSDASDVGTDTTPPPPPEEVRLFWTERSTFDDAAPVRVRVADGDCRASATELCDPGLCEVTEIVSPNEGELLCQRGCAASTDLGHLVFLDATEAGTLRAVELGDDYQPAGASEVIGNDVLEYQVKQDTVVYRTSTALHVHNLATGSGTELGAMQPGRGGFTLDKGGRYLFVNRVTSLTAMQTYLVDLESAATELPVFLFISGEEQGTGSFFTGRERMALSDNAQRLAVLTNARTSGVECGSSADCVAPGESCLTTAIPPRCVRQELSLNVINLTAVEFLRGPCASDVDCGADHFCDLSAPDVDGNGECLPARFSLGPAGPGSCDTLELGQYSDVVGALAWRGPRTVIAALSQDCIQGDIPATDLVALNLDGEAFERVIENPGLDHGGCYDDVEQCYEVGECNVAIEDSAVSPTGGTVALIASSPTARQKNELWVADAHGRDDKELVTRSSEWEVGHVSVHPVP